MYKITNTASYLDKVKWRVDNWNLESCGYTHLTNWGSLRDAGNVALLTALYHSEVGTSSYYDFAKSNIDFILGSHGTISADAPANFSFLIGYNELGGGYPSYPHHGGAFGQSTDAWTKFNTEKTTPGSVPFAYELKGGLAGGPEAACSTFEDNIGNYVSSEYCTYYNAAFTSALAYINKIENNLVLSTPKKEQTTLRAFPNPVQTELNVISTNVTDSFSIVNSAGQSIVTKEGQDKIVFNVEGLAPGVYSVKRHSDKKQVKFVKQ